MRSCGANVPSVLAARSEKVVATAQQPVTSAVVRVVHERGCFTHDAVARLWKRNTPWRLSILFVVPESSKGNSVCTHVGGIRIHIRGRHV
jgi:hypothetical protein